MYRSVTESKRQDEGKRALHRLQGVLVALAVVVTLVYALGWLPM